MNLSEPAITTYEASELATSAVFTIVISRV